MTQLYNQQPYLHDLLAGISAPGLVLSRFDGQLEQPGVSGIYLADRRIISGSVLSIPGVQLSPIQADVADADTTTSTAVLRGLGDPGADPTVVLRRRRTVTGDHAIEIIEIQSAVRTEVIAAVHLRLSCDLADIEQVKGGNYPPELPVSVLPDGLSWQGSDGSTVTARAVPAPSDIADGRLSWQLELPVGGTFRIEITYRLQDDPRPQVVLPVRETALPELTVSGPDPRLGRWVRQSLADLRALELADPLQPDDHFIGAGVPWFLTLFGRDTLIAARMLLPLGTRLAAGTLRTLARRQGTKLDPETAEEPGKILHEIRRVESQHGDSNRSQHALRLPPTYFGTVDATPLWILLLHDAWRWGMPAAEVEALLPNLDRALAWMRDYGMDDTGFLRYADRTGHGLANQGWKDSHDSIQFADGRLADAPVALSEVQAYAYAAANCGADLLDAFGRSGSAEWRSWAGELSARFRDRFWLSDPYGNYPAMALDGSGKPVDAVASNMGHLLGTGLLDAEESALVARRLGSSELSSGFGLRTMASSAAGFNPLSYHGGSVWTHDTAIAITGLAAAAAQGVTGAADAAGTLISGLLAAADAFDYRMPELHGGATRTSDRVTPYPASCRPQAWAAASAVAVLSALLGPVPDAAAGSLRFAPLPSSTTGAIAVEGVQFGGEPYRVTLSADGEVAHTPIPGASS